MKEADGSSASTTEDASSASNEEATNLRNENKKLTYRITQLLRSIEEIESKQAAAQ